MTEKELKPSLSPTFKVVDDQELRVDVFLPRRHVRNNQVQCPIGQYRVASLLKTSHHGQSLRPRGGALTAIYAAIVLHAGAWIFGSSRLINADQLQDCLSRNWIVLSPQFRLCPQVDILEGPIGDTRACLAWAQSGGLDRELSTHGFTADLDCIASYGMSSGGSLALCLGFDVPKPVQEVFAMCPIIMCGHPKWFMSVESMQKLPSMAIEFMLQVYDEKPIPVEGGVRLDGEWCPLKNTKEPWLNHRSAFMYTQIVKGRLLNVCYPRGVETGNFKLIDPYLNVTGNFPATCIAQGTADNFVPLEAPQCFVEKFRHVGVQTQLIEIPGAGHMFTATMKAGDTVYELQRQGFDFIQEVFGRGSNM